MILNQVIKAHYKKAHYDTSKTPVEIIKEGAFRGTYFRDIYSDINSKWYRKSKKEYNDLKNIDQNHYCSNYQDVNVNKKKVNCGASLRFWENKGWTPFLDPYGWFQWYFRYWLVRRSLHHTRTNGQMEKSCQ